MKKREFYYFRHIRDFKEWSIGFNRSFPAYLTAQVKLGKEMQYPRRVFCPICFNDELSWLNYAESKIMDKDLYARCLDGHTIKDEDLLVKVSLEDLRKGGVIGGNTRTRNRKTRTKIQKR